MRSFYIGTIENTPPYDMTLTEIHDRMEYLILAIKKNPKDREGISKYETELAHLEQRREEIEQEL